MEQSEEKTEFAYTNPKMFDRTFIPSQYIKGSNIETYIIQFEGVVIQIIRTTDFETPIHIKINDELIDTVKSKEKKKVLFTTELGEHEIEVWNGRAKNFFFTNFFRKDGVAITIDKIPVQNTLSDPMLIMSEGKVSLWFFFIILLMKGLLQPFFSDFQEVYLIGLIFYIVPALIMLLAALTFSRNPKRAIWIGLIIGILETIEFGYSMFYIMDITYLTLFFLSFRVGCIVALVRTLIALNKLIKNIAKSFGTEQRVQEQTPTQIEAKFAALNLKKIKINTDAIKTISFKIFSITAVVLLLYVSYTYITKYTMGTKAREFLEEGKNLFKEDNKHEAIKFYTKAIEHNPELIEAYLLRGYTYFHLDYNQQAIDDFDQVLKHKSIDTILMLRARAYYNIARVNDHKWDYDTAYADCEKIIKNNPLNHKAYALMSIIKNNLDEFIEALNLINKAIEIEPNESDYYSDRGWIKANIGDIVGAKNDAIKGIQLDSSNARGYLLWGHITYNVYSKYLDSYSSISDKQKEDIWDCIKKMDTVIKISKNKWTKSRAYIYNGINKLLLDNKNEACEDFSKAGDLGDKRAYDFIKEYCK